MSQYLARVRDVDPNDSEAVKDALTVFFQNLLKFQSVSGNQWLSALETVINRFPKYCGQHRATIENYLIPFLDSTRSNSVIIAAKCAHSLQQVRPPQEKAASAKSCWRQQMATLCEAAHMLIDALFPRSAAHNSQNKTIDNEHSRMLQALQDIDNVRETQDAAGKKVLLRVRLLNVLVFIQAMLVEIYPVGKPIRPQIILEVILRALSATGTDDDTIASVKVEALRTMDALVACGGSNLLPFSPLLIRLAVQSLRWTSTTHASKVRITAYNSLSSWLLHLRCERPPGDRAAWDADLTSHVLADVTPDKPLIQVNETVNHQSMKNLSKKARKKLANSMLKQSNIASHMPGEKNKIKISEESKDEVAIAALGCAEAFLTVCGRFLKPLIHKQLVELLVCECATASVCGARGVSSLRALEAARRTSANPPTQYCLDIYSRLVNCPDVEISRLCSQALLDIRLHLHCAPPSLHYTQQPDNKPDRKRMSDRNRLVLEQLLGKERIPSETAQEEVISIPDEPSSKRPRTDEDQISLSSESVASSIEISDDSQQYDDSIILLYPGDDKSESGDNSLTINENNGVNDEIDAAKVTEENVGENKIEENNGIQENVLEKDDVTEENDVTAGEINTDEPLTQSDRINETETQIVEKHLEIFDAVTQLPLHVSNDTVDSEKSPVSMEVTYDYPNTIDKPEKVVLEKMDDENLPSSNETDDIQITCGQQVKSSQDFGDDSGKTKEFVTGEVPKENGVDKSEKNVVNGDTEMEIASEMPQKLVNNGLSITVDDMLADFVDEVHDDTQASV